MSLVLAGCSPVFRFELLPRPETAAVAKWREEVSTRLNDHEERITKMEDADAGTD